MCDTCSSSSKGQYYSYLDYVLRWGNIFSLFIKVEPNNGDSMETLSVTPGITTHSMMIQGSGNEGPQVVQVLSLKDATVLTKAMQGIADVKTEETILSDQ